MNRYFGDYGRKGLGFGFGGYNQEYRQEQIARKNRDVFTKLLAAENITVHHSYTAKTASFDIQKRVVTLPVMKIGTSEYIFNGFIGHEVGHAFYTPGVVEYKKSLEPMSKKYGEKFHQYVNIVEDARIERLMKLRFRGLEKMFQKSYDEMHNLDFFSLAGKNVNKDLLLADRLNILFKIGGLSGVVLNEKEEEFEAKMKATKTFDDVIKVASELYEYCEQEAKDKKQSGKDQQESDDKQDGDGSSDGQGSGDDQQDSEASGDSSEGGEGADGDESDEKSSGKNKSKGKKDKSEKSGKGDKKGDGQDSENDDADGADGEGKDSKGEGDGSDGDGDSSDGDGDDSEDDSDQSDNGGSSKSKVKGQSDNNDDGAEGNTSGQGLDEDVDTGLQTQEDFDSAMQGLFSDNSQYNGSNAPDERNLPHVSDGEYAKYEVNFLSAIKPLLSSLKTVDMTAYYAECNELEPIVNSMVKEFMMRKSANDSKRQQVAKTGSLDMNKLHNYKLSDDIFLRNSFTPDGKNHGFVVWVDWSSSIEGELPDMARQLIVLVRFFKKVGVPFEILGFGNSNAKDGRMSDVVNSEKMSVIRVASSSSSKADLNAQLEAYWVFSNHYTALWRAASYHSGDTKKLALASTPSNPALVLSEGICKKFIAQNRVEKCNLIFLTDGHPDNSGYDFGASHNVVMKNRDGKVVFDGSNPSMGTGIALFRLLAKDLKVRIPNLTITGFFFVNNRGSACDDFCRVAYPKILDPKQFKDDGERREFIEQFGKRAREALSVDGRGYFLVSDGDNGFDEMYITRLARNVASYDLSRAKGNQALLNEFEKMVAAKGVQKVVAGQFIKRIA